MEDYLLRLANRGYEIIQFSSRDGEHFASTGIIIPFNRIDIPYQRGLVIRKKLLVDITDDLPNVLYKVNQRRNTKRKTRANGLILSGFQVIGSEQALEYKVLLTPCIIDRTGLCLF